jgi:hypothetical protein
VAESIGMALGERIMNARFGDDLVDHYTYVFLGDGCLMEGVSQEAISLAGHLKLGRLIAFWDDNSITIDGATSLAVSDDEVGRFRASGWHVLEIDGHDTDAIREAIVTARSVTDRPSMIACRTIIGFGFPTKAGTQKAHSDAPGEDEVAGAREILGWEHPPFVIPEDLLGEWRAIGAKGGKARAEWADRVGRAPDGLRREFERRNAGELPADWRRAITAARREFVETGKALATRQASGAVIDHLFEAIPELLGGSADLTPSNNTRAKKQVEVRPGEYEGSYVHYGVREHGMAAAMNGIGGFGTKRNGLSEADPDVPAKLREQRLHRREEAEALPGRQVVGEDDLLQLGLAQGVEVEIPGQVAPQPPVRVLDRALLPGGVSVAEPRRHRAGARQQPVPGEGGVVVEGDRGPQPRVEPAEDGHHHRHGLPGRLAGEPGGEDEAGLALLEDQHGPGPPADQQVALPMARLATPFDGLGPVVDRGPSGDRGARLTSPTTAAPGAPARQQPPELLGLLRGPMDEGVDGLGGDGAQPPFLAALQPAGDLLRRPALEQALAHEAAELGVTLQDGRPLPALEVAALGMHRQVAAFRQRVAPQLAADGRRRPAEPARDRP